MTINVQQILAAAALGLLVGVFIKPLIQPWAIRLLAKLFGPWAFLKERQTLTGARCRSAALVTPAAGSRVF